MSKQIKGLTMKEMEANSEAYNKAIKEGKAIPFRDRLNLLDKGKNIDYNGSHGKVALEQDIWDTTFSK